MNPEEFARLLRQLSVSGGALPRAASVMARNPGLFGDPRPMPSDATAVAPGAIDPSRNTQSTVQQLLHQYGGGAHREVMAEQTGDSPTRPEMRSLPDNPLSKAMRSFRGSPLGQAARTLSDVLGLGDPMSMIEGPGRAAIGAFGRGAQLDDVVRAAKREGFDVDRPLYHGTGRSFEQFDPSLIGTQSGNEGHFGRGIYFSNDANYANAYASRAPEGGNVRPVFARGKALEITEGEYDDGTLNFYRTMREIAPDDPTVRRVNATLDDVTDRTLVIQNQRPNARGEVVPYRAMYHPEMTKAEARRAQNIIDEKPYREWTPEDEALVEKWNDARDVLIADPSQAVPGITRILEDVPIVTEFAIEGFGRSRLSELAKKAGYDLLRAGDETVVFDPENARSVFGPWDK